MNTGSLSEFAGSAGMPLAFDGLTAAACGPTFDMWNGSSSLVSGAAGSNSMPQQQLSAGGLLPEMFHSVSDSRGNNGTSSQVGVRAASLPGALEAFPSSTRSPPPALCSMSTGLGAYVAAGGSTASNASHFSPSSCDDALAHSAHGIVLNSCTDAASLLNSASSFSMSMSAAGQHSANSCFGHFSGISGGSGTGLTGAAAGVSAAAASSPMSSLQNAMDAACLAPAAAAAAAAAAATSSASL